MTDSETVELEIVDVAYRGKGVARLDGLVYFVAGVLPGEKVRAAVRKRKKNCVEADLLDVVTPAAERIDAVCPLAGVCPGCNYQHVDYGAEVALKQKQLTDVLQRIGGCSDVSCREALSAPTPLNYRNRITLHAQRRRGNTALGYYGNDNESVIDVPSCPLAVDALNDLLGATRADSERMASLGGGDTLSLRWTASDGPLCWSQADGPPLSRLTENTAIGDLLVPSRSFFQVNPAVADMLLGVVGGIIESISPKTVIDLYCGVGGMTFAASRSSAEFLLGIDSDARAIRAARRNAVSLGVENTEFVSGKAAELLDEAVEAVDASQLAVIVDPPRRGLEKEVIEILGRRRPATVVYVSCGADTMARDTRMLVEHGYGVVETGVVDMFPRTAHFESVTVFSQ